MTPNSTYNAHRALEVLFYWCVNSYSTNVTAGNVTTEIVASSSNVVSPGDGDSHSPMVLKSGTDTTEYTVDVYATDVLTFYLLPNLGTGNFSQAPSDPSDMGGTQASRGFTSQGAEVVSYALLPAGLGSSFTPAELADEDATNFKAVQNLTNNIATSLTNTMRAHPYSGGPVLGTAFISQSFVKIKWEWLIFLFVVEVLSIIFLAAIIIETKKEKIAILKSSSLASMCALSEESKNYIGTIKSRGEVLEKASGLEVRLENDGRDRWTLVMEDSSAD